MKQIILNEDQYIVGLNWDNASKKEFNKKFVELSTANPESNYSFIFKYKDNISIGQFSSKMENLNKNQQLLI